MKLPFTLPIEAISPVNSAPFLLPEKTKFSIVNGISLSDSTKINLSILADIVRASFFISSPINSS